MSAPNGSEVESRIPITSTGLRITQSSAIILVQFIFVSYITIYINYWYWINVYEAILGNWWEHWLVWVLLPFSIYGVIYLFPVLMLFVTKILIYISQKKHPPREGVFRLDSPDVRAWQFRQHAMLFAIWFARRVPLPWIDMGFFKLFGVHSGGNPVFYDSWVDTELVRFGRDNMLSLNVVLLSHMIIPSNPRKFLVQGIETSDFCILGAESVVAPGTTLETGAIFGACSVSSVGQHLDGNWIYGGNPLKRLIPSSGAVPVSGQKGGDKSQKTSKEGD